MKQSIIIDTLKFKTTIGVYDWEQAILQDLIVSAKLDFDMTPAFFGQDIDNTLNYKEICDDIQAICHEQKAHLLETLAYQLLLKLFTTYACTAIELILKKPHAIKEAAGVGVLIAMTRQEFDELQTMKEKNISIVNV